MSRRFYFIGLLLFAFWAVMMALVLRREVLVPRAQPVPAGLAAAQRAPVDSWMGIYTRNAGVGEDRVGYVHLTSTRGQRDGAGATRNGMTLKLATTMLSMPTELLLDGHAWVVDGKGLTDFEFGAQSFGEHMMRATGSVAGGRVKVNVETAGESFPLEFPVGQDLMVSGAFGTTSLNVPSLEIGDTVLIDAFDPTTMTQGLARIECIGTENIEYDGELVPSKILTTELGGVTTKTWVGLDETVLRVETPVGLILRRVTQEEALREFDAPGASSELINTVAIRPTGSKKPFRGATHLHVFLSGLSASVMVPEDELQVRIGDGEYLIDTPPAPADFAGPVDSAEFAGELAADPFIQTGHARIVSQAREIVAGETDPWRKATRIYEWVYQNIEKEPVLSLPSALDVLASRRGDCNEHTVLFAALARSVGVPTRVAIGVVWSEELAGFYYHAWPEVYAGRWIPMDPTLGQPIADATHLKLLEGSVGDWPRLVPFLGQLRIEVRDVR